MPFPPLHAQALPEMYDGNLPRHDRKNNGSGLWMTFRSKLEEKSHFMVKEGIVLGHKISKSGIEVVRAKIDVIAKLPHPTTVKGVRSFLGHDAWVYIEDYPGNFSKLARTIDPLLVKRNPFNLPKEYWNKPFELMCDASDFALGAVLGQRHEKHFRPIHYASKTMNEAESRYTTTEKEMLAVVYAFRKIRSYLVYEQRHCIYGSFRPQVSLCKKDLRAEIARWVLLFKSSTLMY
ncbi:reverse transcriptase domain-containing protein [Tanacetum coccineum]